MFKHRLKSELHKPLKEARDLLDKGWIKGDFKRVTDEGYAFCSIGALRETADDYVDASDIADYVMQFSDEPKRSIVAYNDSYSTTKEDIIEIFDKAIAHAEKPWYQFW